MYSLLANQSVLTIRFLSNDSCIKDDTFLSLSSELSSDIEAYQYLDYGQYLWMGYENGDMIRGLYIGIMIKSKFLIHIETKIFQSTPFKYHEYYLFIEKH